MAKMRSDQILEVFPCTAISSEHIKLRPVVDKCYKFIPVFVQIPQLGWVSSFIDPELGIISQSSLEVDCRVSQTHIIELNGELLKFDSIRNVTQKISPLDIHELPLGLGIEDHSYLLVEAFQDLILTNETEEFEKIYHSVHVDEFDRTNHWKDELEIKKTSKATALSATPHTLPGVIESYLFGWLGIVHDVWLNICGVLVTIYTLAIILYCCLPNGLVQPLRNVQDRLQRIRNRRINVRHTNNRNIARARTNSIELSKVQSTRSELRPILRKDSSTSCMLREKKRLDPIVRYSKSVYEPVVTIDESDNLQKSVSNDNMIISLGKRSTPIDIPRPNKPKPSDLKHSVPRDSPRIGSAESWSKLFKPSSSQQRLGDISEVEPTLGTSSFVVPTPFDELSLGSIHEEFTNSPSTRKAKPKK